MVSTYLETNAREVKNNAGGFVYNIGPIERLERFLILGTVGGTYYVGERELTNENLKEITNTIDELGTVAVDKIVEIGVSNRAPKHDPTLVAFAIAVANHKTRAYALASFNDVVRIGTHLFHFLAYYKRLDGGEGRSFKRAIANWYLAKSDEAVAYQLLKYKQRDGFSHRDALRIGHPQATSASQNALFKFATTGTLHADDSKAHAFVGAALEATSSDNITHVLSLVDTYNLPREVINTKFLTDPRTHEVLAPKMGLTALLRNLRNMHKDGYLVQGSDAVRVVRERLLNERDVRKSRIHPAHVFLAKGNAPNIPSPIRDALEDMFFLAFKNVVPTNKRILLALDVSGSMGWSHVPSARGYSPNAREWSALQAMVTARVEPYAEFFAFANTFQRLNITSRDSLAEVIRKVDRADFGGTDCALPMVYAQKSGLLFDAFAIYTDNETWARGYGGSSGSPMGELRKYRKSSGIHDAKLAVVGIASTGFSIADPNDFNTLDFVGFDADAPAIMADFMRG